MPYPRGRSFRTGACTRGRPKGEIKYARRIPLFEFTLAGGGFSFTAGDYRLCGSCPGLRPLLPRLSSLEPRRSGLLPELGDRNPPATRRFQKAEWRRAEAILGLAAQTLTRGRRAGARVTGDPRSGSEPPSGS